MRPVENGAWGSFVSYIVTECAGVAFYQNHVKMRESHTVRAAAMYFLWCYSGKDKYEKGREKARKVYKRVLAVLVKVQRSYE